MATRKKAPKPHEKPLTAEELFTNGIRSAKSHLEMPLWVFQGVLEIFQRKQNRYGLREAIRWSAEETVTLEIVAREAWEWLQELGDPILEDVWTGRLRDLYTRFSKAKDRHVEALTGSGGYGPWQPRSTCPYQNLDLLCEANASRNLILVYDEVLQSLARAFDAVNA